jgi:hypothetical protein
MKSIYFKILGKCFHPLGLALTANDRRITRLKNRHKGKRAFIIGNGPSLRTSDLDLLSDEITFAFNRIYLFFDQSRFRPKYYLVADPLVVQQNYQAINQLSGFVKIYPQKQPLLKPSKESIFLATFARKNPKFSHNPLRCVHLEETISTVAFQLAFYMGIQDVYLLGMDFHYPSLDKLGDKTKRVVISDGTVDHFHSDYRKKGVQWHLPDLDAMKSEFLMVRSTYESSGRRILNATRGGRLELFPRVDFDQLLDLSPSKAVPTAL